MSALGPFEFWRSAYHGLSVQRLNRWGPPPHGLFLAFGRLRFIWWYRDSERGATGA